MSIAFSKLVEDHISYRSYDLSKYYYWLGDHVAPDPINCKLFLYR